MSRFSKAVASTNVGRVQHATQTRFYERLGFRQFSELPFPQGSRLLYFRKDLRNG
jgi:hypothetical protein